MTHIDPHTELFADYWQHSGRQLVTEQLRATVAFVLILQAVFIFLDRIAFPQHFGFFLAMRMTVNLLVVVILLRWRFTHPNESQLAVPAAVAAEVLAMTYATGGPTSDYYVGLIIVFVGMPVLQPIRARDAGWLSGAFCAAFAVSPLIVGAPVDWRQFGIHVIFVMSGAFESVVSCSLLGRARLKDFTQRREIEKARDDLKQLDREKSRFTANVHHELRTPLTLTLAPLEALLGGQFGEVSELQRGYLRTMHTNAQRLLKLINNLLDLAKVEGQQLKLRRQPTAVSELVSELLLGARPLAERKGVELTMRGLEELPVVNVDREALEKIVVNLVGNALKFTDRGGRIEVWGEAASAGEGGIHLVVADTGVGLAADQLERVFDRFAQVDASATRRHEGTGIGLALVQELVELHGGKIWAESQGLGHGSQLHLTLPEGEADAEAQDEVLQTDSGQAVSLGSSIQAMESEIRHGSEGATDARLLDLERNVERAEAAAQGRGAAQAELPRAPEGAPEVLVAEDNADMRQLLGFLLGQEFRVRLTCNGREALEAVRASPPELVLTDVMMPEMSGTELCRALKGSPETEGIPVVLVTSKADREMKVEGLELGADDYVTKPFHPRELMARVRSLVRLRRLQEELAARNALLESTNEELEATLAELKEAGAQLVKAERLAAVGELAAGVAHEVNNPVNFATNALRTLRAYVDDIRRVAEQAVAIDTGDAAGVPARLRALDGLCREVDLQRVTDGLAELVGIVSEGLERTSRLVGDLRDFAAPGEDSECEVDLRRGLESTFQLLRHAMREAGIELRAELTEGLPPVRGHARALNQVFLNLLKNATEALEGRGGIISVGLRQEGASLVVEVRDDGPGIEPDLQARVFEPFFSTKLAGRGTGLGLSISSRIVTEHGGSMEVESCQDTGTTFRVRLPVRSGDGGGNGSDGSAERGTQHAA